MTDDARAKRLAAIEAVAREYCDGGLHPEHAAELRWNLLRDDIPWLLAELRKSEAEVAAARAIMQGFADAAIMVTASLPPPKVGELSAAPTSCWRELHAYLDDPERFVEAARDD